MVNLPKLVIFTKDSKFTQASKIYQRWKFTQDGKIKQGT